MKTHSTFAIAALALIIGGVIGAWLHRIFQATLGIKIKQQQPQMMSRFTGLHRWILTINEINRVNRQWGWS